MSYQLGPQHYAQYSIFKSPLKYALDVHSLNMRACLFAKNRLRPPLPQIAGLAGCRCPSQTSKSGPRRNQRSGGALVACHRVIPSPLRLVRTPSDFIWLSRIRLAYREVRIFRRIRRFFDRNRRRFRGCAKSGRSRHSKCHANQMPKPSQRKLPSP
jgi:hypothetical protein